MSKAVAMVPSSFFITAFFIIFSSVDRITVATGFERLPGEPKRRRVAV